MTRIGIAGAGAIGGTLAARLSAAGHEVSVLARGATLAALRRNGLVLRDLSGELRSRPPASDRATDLGPQDVVFLCAKSHGMADLLEAAMPLIGPDTVVVPAVNGIPWWYFHGVSGPHAGQPVRAVDPQGALLARTPLSRLIGCVVYITAESPEPGVAVSRSPHRLVLGEPGGGGSDRLARLCVLLDEAGIAAQPSPSIRETIWAKLAANLSSNPLSVVAGATLGQIYGEMPLRGLAEAIVRETLAVAEAYGARPSVEPRALLDQGATLGDFRTSMLQDFEAGRPLELADRYAVPMPTTCAVLSLARFRAAQRGA